MRRKITDVRSLIEAIEAAGLILKKNKVGSHLVIYHGGKPIGSISQTKNPNLRTLHNYVRSIKKLSGIDIREGK